MSILFDLILIVVAAICIISGVRRGFIRSVINIVTLAAAVICAYMFMPAVSAYLHEEFIEESVSAPVEEELAGMAGGDESGLAQLFADSPAALSELVGRYNTSLPMWLLTMKRLWLRALRRCLKISRAISRRRRQKRCPI